KAAALRDVGAAGGLAFLDLGLPVVVADEPVERVLLQREQVGDRQRVVDFCERQTLCVASVLGGGSGCVARSSQGDDLRGPSKGPLDSLPTGCEVRPPVRFCATRAAICGDHAKKFQPTTI